MRESVWMVLAVGLAACGAQVPVYGPGDDGWHYELPELDGECVTDRGCVQGGCGNHCVSIDAEPFASTCEYAAHNDYASCGCVQERCRWFADGAVVLGGA